jgi:hypothetical protein
VNQHAQPGRGFDLEGVVDMHVHYGPAPVPPGISVVHSVTALEAAREAAGSGLAAIVLKSKDSCTAPLAHAVQEVVPGVRVFGGVVLDHAVGGINPVAVLQALRTGAKVVWLPTNGSRQDCGRHGPPEYLRFATEEEKRGLAVTDEDGKLLPAVRDVFDVVSEYDAVLATGHITFEEHLAVARELGSSGRVLVTHCGAKGGGPGLDAAQCAELADLHRPLGLERDEHGRARRDDPCGAAGPGGPVRRLRLGHRPADPGRGHAGLPERAVGLRLYR